MTVRVALVAVHLGLMEDAEELLEQAEQWGRLIELYIASGDWDRALFLAENKDRVSLKPTHYQYAKHLEDMGRAAEAIK